MKRKNWPQQLHILYASGIFLTILALLCQIVGRHNRRIDLTREKIHSVSLETLEALRQMNRNDITVRAFFAESDGARREFQLLLKEVATHHPHFRFEFYDPDRSPSETRRYKVDSYRTVVIEYENRKERFQGYSEESLANAFVRLSHPMTQTICFTKGHGEISLSESERTGLSDLKQILEEYQYQIKEVQITGSGVPSDCGLVIMAGPHYELLPKELDLLEKFPEQEKGFLLLVDPMDPGTGKSFGQLAETFGLRLRDDVIVDKVSRVFGGDYLAPLVAQYAEHPITQRFRAATFFPFARTVTRFPKAPENIETTELAWTNPGSWAETDLKRLENGEAELDPMTDTSGPVSLAATAEFKKGFNKGARAVIVGDSDFVSNAHLRLAGNKDFALNIIQWLLRDDRWISIRPKTTRFQPLFLKINQSVGIAAFAVGGLPLTTLMVGSLGIWFRRRKSV